MLVSAKRTIENQLVMNLSPAKKWLQSIGSKTTVVEKKRPMHPEDARFFDDPYYTEYEVVETRRVLNVSNEEAKEFAQFVGQCVYTGLYWSGMAIGYTATIVVVFLIYWLIELLKLMVMILVAIVVSPFRRSGKRQQSGFEASQSNVGSVVNNVSAGDNASISIVNNYHSPGANIKIN